MPDQTCIDWYDGNTGEYITTTGDCSGGGTGGEPPYTGGGGSGPGGYYPGGGGGWGGGGSTSTTGSTSDGSYIFRSTSTKSTNAPPADCSSWQFRSVGPSGYMACGLSDVRIDIISEYTDASGRIHFEYFNFGFDKYNLYFEMPPAYQIGQAATLCARLKDQAEAYIESKYGSSPMNGINPDVIANDFYARLAYLMQGVGGRLSKSANYPNTPVRNYQETLYPDNGGCS